MVEFKPTFTVCLSANDRDPKRIKKIKTLIYGIPFQARNKFPDFIFP